MLEICTQSAGETKRLGRIVGRWLRGGEVVCLFGDLGCGKTTFAQGVASGLGIEAQVTSPTFIIISEYYEGKVPFYHIDAYRLGSVEEAEDIGLDEYFEVEGVVVVEWADKIASMLPPSFLHVQFSLIDYHSRCLAFRSVGNRFTSLMEELRKVAGPRC